MAEILFVGGPADGQWRDINDQLREVSVFVPDAAPHETVSDMECLSTEKIAGKQATYVRYPLSQGDGMPWLYVFSLAGEESKVAGSSRQFQHRGDVFANGSFAARRENGRRRGQEIGGRASATGCIGRAGAQK